MTALASRYAQGCLLAAGDVGYEAVAQDLATFVACLDASRQLQTVLAHPACANQRPAVMDAVVAKLELGQPVTRLLQLLVRRGRMGLIRDVAQAATEQLDLQAGRLQAQVRVSVALTQAQEAALCRQLAKRMGKPVRAQVVVEPELLGGMVCQVGGLTFDSSLKNQMSMLADRLGVRLH